MRRLARLLDFYRKIRTNQRPELSTTGGDSVNNVAKFLAEEGATIVAVSDSTGGIHRPQGLDVAKVVAWKSEHGTVQGFPGSVDISNAEILEVDCDILIPAALENQITERNAGRGILMGGD